MREEVIECEGVVGRGRRKRGVLGTKGCVCMLGE